MDYICYKLNDYEIFELLLLIDWKIEGRFKRVNIFILFILGIIVSITYLFKPHEFYLFIFLSIITAMTFIFMYLFDAIRKNKARKMSRSKSEYKILVDSEGIVLSEDIDKHYIFGTKSEAFISERIIGFKIGNDLFCIPKSALSLEEINYIMDIAKSHCIVRKFSVDNSGGFCKKLL